MMVVRERWFALVPMFAAPRLGRRAFPLRGPLFGVDLSRADLDVKAVREPTPTCGQKDAALQQRIESPCGRRTTFRQDEIGIVLGRHLRKFLTAFRYRHPMLRTVAIDVHFRVQPTRVIEGAGFNKKRSSPDRVGENGLIVAS
jgi:hypothetical protein